MSAPPVPPKKAVPVRPTDKPLPVPPPRARHAPHASPMRADGRLFGAPLAQLPADAGVPRLVAQLAARLVAANAAAVTAPMAPAERALAALWAARLAREPLLPHARLAALLLRRWLASLPTPLVHGAAAAAMRAAAQRTSGVASAKAAASERETLVSALASLSDAHVLTVKLVCQTLKRLAKQTPGALDALGVACAAVVAGDSDSDRNDDDDVDGDDDDVALRGRVVSMLVCLESKFVVLRDGKRQRPALSVLDNAPQSKWPRHADGVPPSLDSAPPFIAPKTSWSPLIESGASFADVAERVSVLCNLLAARRAAACFGLYESGATTQPTEIQIALDMLHVAPDAVRVADSTHSETLLSPRSSDFDDAADDGATFGAPALSCALLLLLHAPGAPAVDRGAMLAGSTVEAAVCGAAELQVLQSVRALVSTQLAPKQRTSNRLGCFQVLHTLCAILVRPQSPDDEAQVYPQWRSFLIGNECE